MMENILAVGVGGALGSILRYIVVLASTAWFGKGFPWGTLIVNVLGSAAIGIAFVVLHERALLGENWRYFFMTGILGGFTTFSAFSLETMLLLEQHAYLRAVTNIVLSVALCVAAAAGAAMLARRF